MLSEPLPRVVKQVFHALCTSLADSRRKGEIARLHDRRRLLCLAGGGWCLYVRRWRAFRHCVEMVRLSQARLHIRA
jgi:hypothetical protein